MTTSTLADDFIQANATHQGGANGHVMRIVIHATVSKCEQGGARANARYFQRADAGGAAHYVVDPYEIIGCVDEDRVAHHAPPNTGSIGVELCDPQAGDPDRWNDQPHTLMLARAAALVADVCARHGIPVQWLTPSQLRAADSGITSHANVSAAWHKTDHTDPGDAFPVEMFVTAVGGTPPEEDDMQEADFERIQSMIDASRDTVIDEVRKVPGWVKDAVLDPIIGEIRKVPGWVKDKIDKAG